MEFPIKKKWTGLGYQIIITFNDYYSGINESGDEVILTIPCTDYRWVEVEEKNELKSNSHDDMVDALSYGILGAHIPMSDRGNGGKESTIDYDALNFAHKIQKERENDYGNAEVSFSSIAEFWSTYISRKTRIVIALDKIDVAHMMELFKINRNAYKRKEDNFIDGESYANFATKFFKEK